VRFLSRYHLWLAGLALAITFAVVFGSELVQIKDRVTREYFAHKEFLFNLRNADPVQRKVPTEKEVRSLLEKRRIRIESIYQNEGAVEVKAKDVEWRFLPLLVRDLERNYRIRSFSAVDNTGKGFFEIRIVVE